MACHKIHKASSIPTSFHNTLIAHIVHPHHPYIVKEVHGKEVYNYLESIHGSP